MIKVKEGTVKISNVTVPDMLTELTLAVRSVNKVAVEYLKDEDVKNPESAAKKMIKRSVELGLMSENEVHMELLNVLKGLVNEYEEEFEESEDEE